MANRGVIESLKSWQKRDARASARMRGVVALHTGACAKTAADKPCEKPRDGYSLCDEHLAARRASQPKTPARLRPSRPKRAAR